MRSSATLAGDERHGEFVSLKQWRLPEQMARANLRKASDLHRRLVEVMGAVAPLGQHVRQLVLTDEDIWGVVAFHPQTSRDFDQRPQLEVRCPQCINCRFDRRAAAETRCAGRCGLQYLPHLLADGLCEDCR